MRIGDTAFGIGHMNCEIADHAPADELLLQESLRQRNVFFHGQFILQSDVIAVSQLRFRVLFCFFHCVPQRCPVSVFLWRVRRQQDFFIHNALLPGIIRLLMVIITEQAFARAVGGSGKDGLSGGAFDNSGMKMI